MDQIERIIHMERLYNELQSMLNNGTSFDALPSCVNDYYQQLSDYMSSGLWLQDYEADERGLLPASMPRGVLSQDALYNLLQYYETKQAE
ncbi:MAG: DUF4298 domain-containing protein [Bacteroidales bacterium]|nr:DUF4298 domain-containing protein [Bacteroidales bacterium]